jgi:hypothetical protein
MKIFLLVVVVVACLPYLCHCNLNDDDSMVEVSEYCYNCTQMCEEEHHDDDEHGHGHMHDEHGHDHDDCEEESEGNNVGLAFGLTIGAGFATNIGAILSFLPCFKRSNITLLAVGLSLAAGFMVYISFVEILGKAGDYFRCHTEEHAALASTGCFFLGIVLTLVLQFFLDALQGMDLGCRRPWGKKKVVIPDQQGTRKKYSGMMKRLKSKLTMGKNSDCDEEKTIGVPNITVTESKISDETKVDSISSDSEIVAMTDKNYDEVSIRTRVFSNL